MNACRKNPLMYAVKSKQSYSNPALSLLIEKGCDITIRDSSGKTALNYALKTTIQTMAVLGF